MKKFFMFLAAVCMISLSAVSLTSCGSDDDSSSDDSTASVQNQLIGTWKGSVVTSKSTTYHDGIASTSSETTQEVTLTISKGAINIVTDNYNKTYTFNIVKGTGDYYMDLNDGTALFFQVSGNTLKLTGSNSTNGIWLEGTYTKQ